MQEIRVQEKIEELNRENLQAVLATAKGRFFIYQLLGRTHAFQRSYVGGSEGETCFLEGERAVGLWLLSYFESMGILDLMRTEYEQELLILEAQVQKEMEEFDNGRE